MNMISECITLTMVVSHKQMSYTVHGIQCNV